MTRVRMMMASAVLAGGAGASPAAPHGYVNVSVSVQNRGAAPVLCTALLAHWYTSVFLRAASGAMSEAFVLSDPVSGTVYLLNEHRTPMPIEQILCGPAEGAPVAVALARRAGAAEPPVRLVCDDAGCAARGGP